MESLEAIAKLTSTYVKFFVENKKDEDEDILNRLILELIKLHLFLKEKPSAIYETLIEISENKEFVKYLCSQNTGLLSKLFPKSMLALSLEEKKQNEKEE